MARAKLLLQEIETYAQNIGDTIRDPLIILDRDLCVKSANRAFYQTFQTLPEETEDRPISKLGDGQWNIPSLLDLLRNILPTKGHFDNYEVTHDFPEIGTRTMLLNARKLYRPGNRTVLLVLAIEDITERKRTELALAESEEHFRTLYETMAQGVLYQDAAGTLISANPAAQRLLGLSIDEMAGRISADPRWKAVHEDGTAFPSDDHPPMRALRTGQPVRGVVMGIFNPRLNEMRWLSVDGVPQFRPGEDRPYQVYSTFEDITDRKHVAAELAAVAENHSRQAAVMAVLEERTRLAHEIHDTLAQGFTGITMQLEAADAALAKALELYAPDDLAAHQAQLEKVHLRIGKARDLARESLTEARRSVLALRSQTLEAVSLSDALARFLTQETLGAVPKSRYVLEGDPYRLPGDLEHCLLRIGQEAIANAVTHAHAQEIGVDLSFAPGQVRLRVNDDGHGFNPDLLVAGRFGVIGMQERAKEVRGKLNIISHPGAGTEIDLIVPVPQETHKG